MKPFVAVLALMIILGVAGVFLYASPAPSPTTTPALEMLSAFPTIVTVSKLTPVTITVSITNPSPITNSVNLIRIAAAGTQSTILGVMHDDGKNNDAVAGDGVYTLQVPFNEPNAGQIQLQVSAAFQGLLKRVTSLPLTITVSIDGTKPLPPDPGPAGMTTLQGIDSDQDGIRDDLQRYIGLNFPNSSKQRSALTQAAVAIQGLIIGSGTLKGHFQQLSKALDCLDYTFMTSDADVDGGVLAQNDYMALRTLALNTPARAKAFYQSDSQFSSGITFVTSYQQKVGACLVAPSFLPN
jgi:hypothetical protein